MNNRTITDIDQEAEAIEPGFEIMLPCEPAQFGEFISGLLGKPQTIEKGFFGAFEVTKDDLINTHHLIEQRLHQQNAATLVQFTARVIYDDDSSVLLNSLDDFEHYAEIRPIASVGVVLSWTYLIHFRGKPAPEKQEINISFQSDRRDIQASLIDDGFLVGRPGKWPMASHVLVRISHTERTWGVDIESLLTGHIKTLLKTASATSKYVCKHSGNIGLATGATFFLGSTVGVYLASTRFIDAYTLKLKSLNGSSSAIADTTAIKIDFLLDIISTGAWPRFVFASIAFLVASFVVAIVLGIWVSSKAENSPASHVLLSKAAEERRQKISGRIRRDWLTFYISLFASIATGIVSNVLFTRYFSTL